jgi:hypothetical protein
LELDSTNATNSLLALAAWRGTNTRGDGLLALVRVERNSAGELSVLMQRLLGRGEPRRVLTAQELAGAA